MSLPDRDCPQLIHSLRVEGGRRIYVHEDSFRHLAFQGKDSAVLVYRMAAQVSLLKIIYHQVLEDGVHLGNVSKRAAERLVGLLEEKWSDAASRTLKELRYVFARVEESSEPVLNVDESIAATCYFDRYYTFATGPEAAERMYRDQSSIPEILRKKESGLDYQDLVLIRGASLVVGGSSATPANRRLSESEAGQIRMDILRQVREDIGDSCETAELTSQEKAFVNDKIHRALALIFTKGILKTT